MLRRVWVDGVHLDMTRVHSYGPVLRVGVQGFLPVVLLCLAHDQPRNMLLVLMGSVLGTSAYTAFRDEVFVFDTSRVALETLAGIGTFTFLHCKQPERCGLIATVLLVWSSTATLYKLFMPPTDSAHSAYAVALGCFFAVTLVAMHEVRDGLHFDHTLNLLKAGIYIAMASLDAYTTCLFTTKRDGVNLQCRLNFFLHWSLLFVLSLPMALLLSGIFLCTQTALIVRMQQQGASPTVQVFAAKQRLQCPWSDAKTPPRCVCACRVWRAVEEIRRRSTAPPTVSRKAVDGK